MREEATRFFGGLTTRVSASRWRPSGVLDARAVNLFAGHNGTGSLATDTARPIALSLCYFHPLGGRHRRHVDFFGK